eukprot:Em0006g242a
MQYFAPEPIGRTNQEIIYYLCLDEQRKRFKRNSRLPWGKNKRLSMLTKLFIFLRIIGPRTNDLQDAMQFADNENRIGTGRSNSGTRVNTSYTYQPRLREKLKDLPTLKVGRPLLVQDVHAGRLRCVKSTLKQVIYCGRERPAVTSN